jgi:hypothetical protein
MTTTGIMIDNLKVESFLTGLHEKELLGGEASASESTLEVPGKCQSSSKGRVRKCGFSGIPGSTRKNVNLL